MLNKNGIDLKAILRDQKAIDALPNKGRVPDHLSSTQRFNRSQYKRIEKAYAKGEIDHDKPHFKSVSRHSRAKALKKHTK